MLARLCTFTTFANAPDGSEVTGPDMFKTGGVLDVLGMPTAFHQATKMVHQERDPVLNIEAPFASDIEGAVFKEQEDAPLPNFDLAATGDQE